jgi:hypothetical protein
LNNTIPHSVRLVDPFWMAGNHSRFVDKYKLLTF